MILQSGMNYLVIQKKNKFDFIPGKGRLVLDFLDKNPDLYEILYHNYSVVLKKL